MTVVKSFPAAVVYDFAITSMNDVMRDYVTSSRFYYLHVLILTSQCALKEVKLVSVLSKFIRQGSMILFSLIWFRENK